MKVAVTGATGFVGRELMRQLGDARPVKRDEPLAEAFAGADAVVHLVGIIHERGANTFERAHVELTRAVLESATAAGVRRYLHMSALGTRPDGRSHYHRTKWAAEELVRQSGLAWTILRPSVIYGPEDKSVNVLAAMLRRLPVATVLGDGNGKIQPISVENVARAFVAALGNGATAGRTYDLCGPAAFTWNELYDKLASALGLRRPKLHLPLGIARAMAAVMEQVLHQPPFTRDQLLMVGEDNVGDPQPSERDLSVIPEVFEDGLARYLTR
ncbi:MAG: complex I NDUFA9 subunit family protein [Verrucomicrobia bacterium]|nr:complex I NDUFA9 subunit family protein [Verrucomicrobiota bacterium]